MDIGGRDLANTRKFRNVQSNDRVAFVVDDLASRNPWWVRCVEIRGRAEALRAQEQRVPGFSGEVTRVYPNARDQFRPRPKW